MSFIDRLFGNRKEQLARLESQVANLMTERDELRDDRQREKDRIASEIRTLKDEKAELEFRMKHDSEDLAHLIKIRDSKYEITIKEKTLELEVKKNAEVQAIRDEYQKKLEGHLNERIVELNKAHKELLDRLPNIEVALKGRVGSPA